MQKKLTFFLPLLFLGLEFILTPIALVATVAITDAATVAPVALVDSMVGQRAKPENVKLINHYVATTAHADVTDLGLLVGSENNSPCTS